uniref:Uncharacterized protein n=1 Tax=Cannabis sativa TaxID=3483 RepID=A0A803NTW9_CANSA
MPHRKPMRHQIRDALNTNPLLRPETSSLTNIKQQPGESRKAYLSLFSTTAARVRNLNDSIQLTALQAGIAIDLSTVGGELWDDLHGFPVMNINEFNEGVQYPHVDPLVVTVQPAKESEESIGGQREFSQHPLQGYIEENGVREYEVEALHVYNVLMGHPALIGLGTGPGSCNFWRWLDPKMCDRSRQVIPGLLRKIKQLESEISSITENEEESSRKSSMKNHTWASSKNESIHKSIPSYKKPVVIICVVLVMIVLYFKY